MSKLSQAQQDVVAHDGHLLVVAGPGSGKTTTSVSKARRILRDPGRSLVMVTFTKEGAEEMRKRLVRAFEAASLRLPGEERLLIATFHSIALRHLKRHGLRKPLLGPREQSILFNEATDACRVDPKEWQDVQKDFERLMYSMEPQRAPVSEVARKVAEVYAGLLERSGQVDLYTVMRDCALGVANGTLPPLPYTDMLVDEGQDTDGLQQMWIFGHAHSGCRVTIVGDDDQSIYEWRNALGFEGMRSFLQEFSARSIELGDNYRCRSEVLTGAATLIAKNAQRLGKTLVAKRGAGGFLTAFSAGDAQNELLAELIVSSPQVHRNAAILARVNRSLDKLEVALRSKGISYTRVGPSIWDNQLIVGYLGLLQSLLDGTPTGLLAWFKGRNVDQSLRQELLDVSTDRIARLLEGEIPPLTHMTAGDRPALAEIAEALAYWRRQLRAGSVREVVLDVAQAFSPVARNDHQRKLLSLCAELLSKMQGTLSTRLQVVSRAAKAGDAELVLMTMHGAKGLEFETVHIIDANQPEDVSTLHVEAERRLMYVAITRAKNACVLWYSASPHPAIAEADLRLTTMNQALQEGLLASASGE